MKTFTRCVLAGTVLALASIGGLSAGAATNAAGHEILDVWPGNPPGSEPSTVPEGSVDVVDPRHNTPDTIVTNVTHPSLQVVLPTTKPNGAALIIAPGGGFHVLSYGNEGIGIAKWAADHGFTAFILKYRLYPMPTDPAAVAKLTQSMGPPPGMKPGAIPVGGMPIGPREAAAIADGTQAIKVVRALAGKYHFDPARVGFVGFSAGGMVSGSQGVSPVPADRANFVGIIYSNVPGSIPAGAPPAFMAAAADDPLSDGLPDLFHRWRAAGAPAELHIYAKGQHGFGSVKQGLPVDGWLDAFYAWMVQQGFVAP